MRAGILTAMLLALLGSACTSLEGLSGTADGGGPTGGDAGTDASSCGADLANDIDNCGTCGNRCPLRANGFPACEAGKCKTTCNTGFGDCDGIEANGCETSVTADGKNCGACKRDCRGGTCTDSVCQPVVMATTADNPYGMAMDATDIYWVSSQSSTVWSCPKAGCAGGARKVGTATGATYFVSVDANNVYFNSNSGDAMYRCAKSGCGTSPELVTSVDAPTLSRVDNGLLYWSCNTGDLRSAPVGATNVTSTIVTNVTDAVGFAFDGTWVYVASRSPGALLRAPKAGGVATPIEGSFPGAAAVAADASGVYVGTNTGDIKRVVNETMSTFAKSGGNVGFAIQLTNDDVFWTVMTSSGAVMTAPKTTGVARAIATGQASPAALLVDDQAVYWTSSGDGTVKMLVR